MSNFHLRLTLSLALSLLVACAKAKNTEPATSPQQATKEVGDLMIALDARGEPNPNWSEEQIAADKAKTARIRKLEKIIAPNHPEQFAQLNAAIAHRDALSDSVHTMHSLGMLGSRIPADQSDKLIGENEQLLKEIEPMGRPNVAWKDARLKELRAKIDQVTANAYKLSQMPPSDERQAAIDDADDLRENRILTQKYLDAHEGRSFDPNSNEAI